LQALAAPHVIEGEVTRQSAHDVVPALRAGIRPRGMRFGQRSAAQGGAARPALPPSRPSTWPWRTSEKADPSLAYSPLLRVLPQMGRELA
jgi:hypothetical protein